MADVRRPRGVTAAAVIAFIGSAGVLLYGLLMAFGAVALNMPEAREQMARQAAPPISPLVMLALMGVMALGFAAWGIASAVGLLRLKAWSRISFLIYGGILAGFGAMNVLGAVGGMVMFSVMPLPNPDVPRGLMIGVMGVMGVLSACAAGVGVWWLIMFNRAAIKAQFVGHADITPLRAPIPKRVLVVAWLLVLPVIVIPIFLAMRTPVPAFVLGMEVRGWWGPAFVIGQLAVAVVAGIGLLRRRAGALVLAVAFYVFGMVNFVAMALMPGGLRRVIETYQSSAPDQAFLPATFFDSMMTFILGATLLFNLALVVLLISARGRYLQACEAARS